MRHLRRLVVCLVFFLLASVLGVAETTPRQTRPVVSTGEADATAARQWLSTGMATLRVAGLQLQDGTGRASTTASPGGPSRAVEWVLGAVLLGMGAAIVGLSTNIRRRRRAEASLRSSHELLNAISDVQSLYITGADPRAVFEGMLSALLKMTQSEYGFIGEVLHGSEGKPYLKTQAITNIAWDEATRAFYAAHAPEGMEFRNLDTLFGAVMTSARPVLSNDPARDPRARGLPPGHPSLDAFMGLPLFRGEQLVGMVGVANRREGYSQEMAGHLQPFLSTCAGLTHAIRDSRQRRVAEEALRESEARLRTAVESIPFDFFLIDVDGRYVLQNSASRRSWGDVTGKRPEDVTSDEDQLALWRSNNLRASAGETIDEEVCRTVGAEQRFVRNVIAPIVDRNEIRGVVGLNIDTTDSRRAEARLLESEERFALFMQYFPGLAYIKDADTRVLFASQGFQTYLGMSPPEMLGKTNAELFPPEFADRVTADDRRILASGAHEEREERYAGRDWSTHKFVLHRPGRPPMLGGFTLDITERMQAEDALRQSRNLLGLILDTIPARVFWKDRDSRYLGCNRPFALDAGLSSPDEIIGQDDYQMGWRDQADLYRCDDRQVMESGSPKIDYEEPQTTPDGRRIWLRTSKVPLREVDGAVFGVLGTYQDITDHKRAEQALSESEERLRLALTAASQGLYDLNVQTGQALVSPEYATMLGYDPTEFRETNARWFERMHPDDRDRVTDVFRAYLRGESPTYSVEFRQRTKSGAWKWILSLGKIVARDAEGRPQRMLGTHTDITERKHAEQALVNEKERVQVTLHSIGDAVITTDAYGMVEYLNPVGEKLTGWLLKDAVGQPLSAVFRIVNDETGEPAADPVARCLLEGRITGLANHTRLISRSGHEYTIQDSAAPIRGSTGEVFGAVLVFSDVTETHRLAKQIAHEATHDTLTGLVNRREFERRLGRALDSAKAHGVEHALCYLDLDQFKVINDTAGHAAGDELLKQIKGLLARRFRERDTFARLGGDEFGLLLDNCPLDKACEIAERLVATIYGHRFAWEGRSFQIGASIGLAPITAYAQSTAQLLSQADVACYTAKERGRNRVHVYQADDRETGRRHGELLRAAGLRDALEQRRLLLYCQPIVSLSSNGGTVKRYEILIRMLGEKGELVEPHAFIPAAERYGMMNAMDRWVIETAFRHYSETQMASGAEMSINLSGNSLNDHTLLEFVQARFTEFALPPERVCFEITETAAIHNLSQATQFMTTIKRRGSRLALDDFGSGLSSFKYLKTLPIDYLKIDGSFVMTMTEDFVNHALVAAINDVGHLLGIQTIGEHAHSPAIVEKLRALGVDYAQGYALGVPVPMDQCV